MAISPISSLTSSVTSPIQNAVSGGGPAASDVSQLSNSLSAMSGGGAAGGAGGGDLIGGAKAQYGGGLSGEQSQMLAMQEAVNRQSEAAAMMAALEKARHDAIMSIVQKIG